MKNGVELNIGEKLEKKTCLDCFNLIRTQNNRVKCISPVGKLKKELPSNTLPRSFEVLAEHCPGYSTEDEDSLSPSPA